MFNTRRLLIFTCPHLSVFSSFCTVTSAWAVIVSIRTIADFAWFASFRPDVRDHVPPGRREQMPAPRALLLLETGGDQLDRVRLRLARPRIRHDPKVMITQKQLGNALACHKRFRFSTNKWRTRRWRVLRCFVFIFVSDHGTLALLLRW